MPRKSVKKRGHKMFTRKHYRAIAEIIKETANKAYQITHTKTLTEKLADFFAADNPNFNREKFIAATKN